MRKNFLFICLCAIFFGTISVQAIDLSAECAVLYEPVSNRFIFEKNKDEKRGIASTTKIVTAITALEYGDLSDDVCTSKTAADIEGSSVWLEEGEIHTMENLLYALLLSSGNDASVAIAEHIGGLEESFVSLMNQTAQMAGAQNSNFKNPSGLDDEDHYSTAADLARLMNYAEKNPIFTKIIKTKKHEMPWEGHPYNRVLENHNRLLTLYEGCTGGKTGFTKKCGRCLVSSATKNGVHLIAVTLNAPDDWNDHIKMFDYGFSLFENRKITEHNAFVGKITINNGQKTDVDCVYESALSIPVLESDSIHTEKRLTKNTTAPIRKGTVVGYTDVILNNKNVARVNIIANESCLPIYKPGFYDYFCLFLRQLF